MPTEQILDKNTIEQSNRRSINWYSASENDALLLNGNRVSPLI